MDNILLGLFLFFAGCIISGVLAMSPAKWGHALVCFGVTGALTITALVIVWGDLKAPTDVGPPIYEPFRVLYRTYQEKLGPVIATAVPSLGNYIGRHQKGNIIWLRPTKRLYALDDSHQNSFSQDQSHDPDLPTEWHVEECLRWRFFPETPVGLWPPWGDIAKRWYDNPDKWKWIGYREWHCGAAKRKVFVQRFKNGVIAGPFRSNPYRAMAMNVAIFEINQTQIDWRQDDAGNNILDCLSPDKLVCFEEDGTPTNEANCVREAQQGEI